MTNTRQKCQSERTDGIGLNFKAFFIILMSEHYEHDKQITARIIRDIEFCKLHVAYVESDGYCPGFGYSIGLFKSFNHPELIIIGLDPDSTGIIINSAKKNIEDGVIYLTGVNYPGFLMEKPVRFVEVQLEHYADYLGYAGWYNDQSFDFPTLQIVWPDNSGIFPWEPGFNEKFKFRQPLLDRNTDFKFLEERNLGVFTTDNVLNGAPVLYVYHNEDGDWQFHSEAKPDSEHARIVCLEELVRMDNSLNGIYYLNYGESAFRKSKIDSWEVDK